MMATKNKTTKVKKASKLVEAIAPATKATRDFSNEEYSRVRKDVRDDDALQEALVRSLESTGDLPDAETLPKAARGIARDSARVRGVRASTSNAVHSTDLGAGTPSAMEDLIDAAETHNAPTDFPTTAVDAGTALLAEFAGLAKGFARRAAPHCNDPKIEALALLLQRAQYALESQDIKTLKAMAAPGKGLEGQGQPIPNNKTDRIQRALNANHRFLPADPAAESVLDTVASLYPELEWAQDLAPTGRACVCLAAACKNYGDEPTYLPSALFGRCGKGASRSPQRTRLVDTVRLRLRQWDEEHPKPAFRAEEQSWREERSTHAVTAALTALSGDAATTNKIMAPARLGRKKLANEAQAEAGERWEALEVALKNQAALASVERESKDPEGTNSPP